MLRICYKFREVSQRVSELLSGHDSPTKFSKEHNLTTNVDAVIVLIFVARFVKL